MNVNEIAERLGGTVQGDGSIEITDVNGMELAQPGQITFLADKKFLNKLKDSRASAVIVQKPLETDKAQVIHPAPALAFAKLLAEMKPEPRPEPGIDKQSSIAEGVKLGKEVTIGPFVSVGKNVTIGDHTVLHPGVVVHDGCTLGDHTTLHAHVTLYRSTVVGNHVTIHAGAVIGADGFGYTPDEKGRHFKINQTGRVVIEDHVEIGANTCIDRANFGETVVREGTKIDNLTQIAHNCEIGQHAIIVAQVGLAGSTHVGNDVVLAGQVGLADHLTIGNQVVVAAQSGVNRDLPDPGFYGGSPAVPAMSWKRYATLLPKLPEMTQKIRDLEKRLKAIENK
ncbi:MAG: UDP-3-O-(3-hydroxymyristoyl)glucosamine N-acyltransferase [Nitrospinaceae bacterium]|nr:UDP-3-O-(3-hydroxymyristoyl)glucosamine N-acyltransferase [Nitrospinaceae bacterium]NIR53708.1 UDP-3-O-(3-hydroxymyristoyl)glucosamine N-acyltransferase [Nitrospinaceae bacterium]NIS84116.1 UDP-3-O-(3-hydroxymyristoyl)glucosamine N-acyltransferase [Nitrospinaceae bacterium]NIT80917.1 UDP-3-O-(3-hydroxymyristoyl)glucosamine N-acyltransferase [Nitrospinaceae bacterium]NIU43215.1 UDP-3-O-(3-hydroxymyristoyl)glucosamine N-acyltransferase [Nitrospinaceae bacterium]